MEGNRDESERCMKLAEDYIKLGLTEKAKKFIHKAERLYPSKKAKGVFVNCDLLGHTEKGVWSLLLCLTW